MTSGSEMEGLEKRLPPLNEIKGTGNPRNSQY